MDKNKDERIVNESNKIYKICYYILMIIVMVDIIIEFNIKITFTTMNGVDKTFIFKVILFILLFYINFFLHASKGVLLGIKEVFVEHIPVKKMLSISLLYSSILSFFLWIPRIIYYKVIGFNSELSVSMFIIFVCLFLVSFIVLFVILNVSYLIAYGILRYASHKIIS